MGIEIFQDMAPASLRYGIFDFDNGAVNTEDVFAVFDCGLLNEVLAAAGLKADLQIPVIRAMAGNSGEKKLDILGKLKGFDVAPYREAFTARRTEQRKTLFSENPAPLGRGLEVLLAHLGERRALATNKTADKLEADLAAMGYQDLFQVVVTSDGLSKKPAPDILLMAAVLLGAQPEECAYFGDNVMDIEAAVAAGFAPIGYIIEGLAGHEARVQAMQEAGAWVVTDDYADVVRFFEALPQSLSSGFIGFVK